MAFLLEKHVGTGLGWVGIKDGYFVGLVHFVRLVLHQDQAKVTLSVHRTHDIQQVKSHQGMVQQSGS